MFSKNYKTFRPLGPSSQAINKLPSGAYTFEYTQRGPEFSQFEVQTDGLVELQKSTSEKILEEIRTFFSKETLARFKRYDILYKRNILMEGPPGTGKTTTIYKVIEWAGDNEIVVLVKPRPDHVTGAIDLLREDDSERKVIVIWEEFESLVHGWESDILEFLDGIRSRKNVMTIATTNYIERIPQRIQNRPSRFPRVLEVGYPVAEERRAFITSKVHSEDLESMDMDWWVEQTKGVSLDHVKDLILSHFCMGVPKEEAVKRIHDLNSSGEVEKNEDEEEW